MQIYFAHLLCKWTEMQSLAHAWKPLQSIEL